MWFCFYPAVCLHRGGDRARFRRRVGALLGVSLALASVAAPARTAAQSDVLRLGDAYRAIDASNPRIAAARSLARASAARVPSAKLPPDPEVQLGFMNYALPGLEPMDPLGMVQLQLMQMIPIPGKLRESGRIARARAASEAARADEVEWTLRADVAMAFYDLYQTDRQLAVARETLRLLQDIRRTAESMYRVGEGRQADVLRAQVAIARMEEDTVRMTTMRTAMAARLNALLDRSVQVDIASPVLPEFPDTVPPLDSLVAAASAERPMILAGEREVEAAEAQTRLARREVWPDLTVGVQYGQRSGEMGTERMGSLMLGASVPIFARRRQLRMRDEAEAMRQMAVADVAAMRADTRARVAEAYAGLARARNLATLYRSTVLPQAEAAVTSAHAAYRTGSVDFMTLLDTRMTVNEYRQELFALEAEQGKAWAELEMLIGMVLVDPGEIPGAAGQRED
jgi:outer membrane protein, heavy metal efflux system